MKFTSHILVSLLLVGQSAGSLRLGSPLKDSLLKSPEDDVYVVSYSRGVTLEDLIDTLEDANVHVERQLSCTRGVVVKFDSDSIRDYVASIEGMEVHAYSATHAGKRELLELGGNATKHTDLDLSDVFLQNGGRCNCERFKQPDVFSFDEMQTIQSYIVDHIKTDTDCFDGSIMDCAGALLRNAFHDAAPFNASEKSLSGANGCVDPASPGNNGLAAANAFLGQTQKTVFRWTKKHISMADLIAIGGSAAVKATGGPSIQIKLGRRDIPCACEETILPPAETPSDAAETVSILADQLGMTEVDIVALMASHTIGRLAPENTGFSGTWVPEPDAALFTNTYFWGMFCIRK